MRENSPAQSLGEVGKDILSFADLGFKPVKIKKISKESPKVKSFYLEHHGTEFPRPGQFVMAWLPSHEEVPMSISGAGDGFIRISVANEGPTSAGLHKLKSGGRLFLRGPYGNGFSIDEGPFLIVGGGYGTAPLIYAAKSISESRERFTFIVGAKKKSELLFLNEARKLGVKVEAATDDGSAGHHGFVTDLVELLLKEKKFKTILTCGPERMMYEVVKHGVKRGIRVQASLERYMKCGFGICGSCVLDPIGLRVCSDGPVFDGALLLKTEFGKRKRDASGARVTI
ncbi:MAG: dihydroorotate dehydrogenase electron transfer subunit [Methanobacteriota archaeon]